MTAVLVCMTALGPGSTVQAAKAPPTCNLVPELRDVAVTQGVGSYTPIVRGKETLVRGYLAKPACAASTAIIELTGGSLTVIPGTAAAVTVSNPTPRPTSPFPQLALSTSAPLVDSTADPVWVVPGSALAPSNTTARFTATFRLTVTYQSKASATATPVPGSITFTSRTGTTTPITATVEKLTNALRVLVVPMGDASQPFASQYTASGDAAVQAAMLTLSRIYPLPEGVGSLTGTTGGLRYSVSPGMLDLRGVLGTDGRFCGTGGSNGNFNAIKASLGQFLQSWNAANGAASQADRVLGVVDAAISNGSAQGCAEGMAAINSNEAWVRAVPEQTGVPSQSGLVTALELGHTFGLVLGGPSPVPDRDDLFSKYHSPNIYADPQRKMRSFNTRLRSVLVDDLTAMTYIGTANNNNTLLEQLDWAYLICRFGGATSTECPQPAVPVGSGAGVAAGPRFVISGVTDGTAAGTQVLESFFSANMLPTPQVASSPYRLVYRGPSNSILSNFGLAVQTEDSAHAHDDDGDEVGTALTLFSGAFDFPGTPTRIELWKGNPGASGSVQLYARDRTAAPVLTNLSVTPAGGGPANFTNDALTTDFSPALSADGRWIAWPAFTTTEGPLNVVVRVAPVDDIAHQARLSDGDDIDSSNPAWCSDGARLAYIDPNDGSLWTIPVNTTSVPATFGTATMIYDPAAPGHFEALNPTWSPDCSQLAFEADDDIWRIDSDGTDVVALTNDDSSHNPSWSPDPGNNVIAFVLGGATAFNSADATYASFVKPDLEGPVVVQSHGGNHFVVTNSGDGDDGTCDAADCSLREAINAANAMANVGSIPDEIEFDIGGSPPHFISPATELPSILTPMIIDGTTQAGYVDAPIIEIDGSATPASSDGFVILPGGAGSTIRGLAINAFPRFGIRNFADNTVIDANYIGVKLDGATASGNGSVAINSLAGDAIQINGNVISGNGGHGIIISGGTAGDPVTNVVITGNMIGVDAAGTGALGNGGFGILLTNFSSGTLVGGSNASDLNVISANAFGIVIGADADNNIIQGNYIGTDVTGTVDLGNLAQGIEITDSHDNVIGNGVPNVISGNGELPAGADGVRISGDQATGNVVNGNMIGLDATGDSPLGNTDDGVEINGDASGTQIRFNSIDDNGGLGIDLAPDGVTPNDADDSDIGANALQNFPVVDTAVNNGTATTVTGTLTSLGDFAFSVELYASDSCDPSGNGEGARPLGSDTVVTAPDGTGSFSLSGIPTTDAGPGDFVTATATDLTGFNTSEFSVCAAVTTTGYTVNSANDNDDGSCDSGHCSLREAINASNAAGGFQTIAFAIPGAGQQTISPTTSLPLITDAATIDGTSQPGYAGAPLIVVDGTGAGSGTSGLVLDSAAAAGGSTIQGLAVVGFEGWGIEVRGSSDHILDNYVGTPDGTGATPNGNGVLVDSTADTTEVRGNVVSGNAGDGIELIGDVSAVHGNHVGTTALADLDLGNGGAGIVVQGGTNQRIGTGTAGDGNVISGNAGPGILVIAEASIQGNKIGTNAAGTGAIANGAGGIDIDGGAAGIGGTVAGMGNQISGNVFDGVLVRNDGNALIMGNLIGTNAAGTAAISNSRHGVNADDGGTATLGGAGASRNVISGNGAFGVAISDNPGLGILSTLHGNYIGTNANGTGAVPNVAGVVVTNANDVIIGQDPDGNLISGNIGPGIIVTGTSSGVEIAGNVIGLNFSADVAIPNGDVGIYLAGPTSGTIIGGDTDTDPFVGNTIAANALDGILIDGSNGNVVQGNLIGTNSEGTDFGNGGAGVSVTNSGQSNRVGADQSGTSIPDQAANVIAFNGGNGVQLTDTSGISGSTEIHSNAIFENGGLGIDLGADGVTPNDVGIPPFDNDGDDGPNDLTNFPDFIEGTSDGVTTTGTIISDSAESALITVYQLFVSSSCDPSGNGEGERYLTSVNTIADGTGHAEAPFSIPEDLEDMFLTATTSDVNGLTSEFSQCFEVLGAGAPDEIHLLDPTTPLGTTAFVVAGSDPAWRGGNILYETGDEIHSILPDGSGDATITSGFTDAQPAGAPGLTAFTRTQGGDSEIWLLRDGSTIDVTATDANPQNLRLDLYYVCGGQSMPIAVALAPDAVSGNTATFQTNYDPSLSCSGGTITVALTDGFLRTTTPPGGGQPVASDPKPPVAATYGPPLGSTYLTSDVIPFHGLGEDADDGTLPGTSLAWFIRGAGTPCCGTLAGTGSQVDFQASNLAPGDYIVTLIVTDADGQTDTAESLIHVLADSDHDGLSDVQENTTCFGTGAATNGSTPSGDADGDGLPNASDPDPCVVATVYNGTADFDPDDLSLGSSGTPITIYIRTPGRNISQVVASSVKITNIGGVTVNIGNVGWTISGDRATAKFPRQTVTQFLKTNGAAPGPTWFTISGNSNTNPVWRFEARDFTNVKP